LGKSFPVEIPSSVEKHMNAHTPTIAIDKEEKISSSGTFKVLEAYE
jgi:hypothetical protein